MGGPFAGSKSGTSLARSRPDPSSARTRPAAPTPRRSARRARRSGRGGAPACARAPAARRQRVDAARGRPSAGPRGRPTPPNSAGRVYCGYSSRPVGEGLVAALDASLPSTPGTRRTTASMTHSAASSPPASTKSPRLSSSSHAVVEHALVDPLVAPAQQREPVELGELARDAPGRSAAARRREREQWAREVGRGRVDGRQDRLGRQHHARRLRRTACRRRCGAASVARVAQVVDAQVPHARARGRARAPTSTRRPSTTSGKMV